MAGDLNFDSKGICILKHSSKRVMRPCYAYFERTTELVKKSAAAKRPYMFSKWFFP